MQCKVETKMSLCYHGFLHSELDGPWTSGTRVAYLVFWPAVTTRYHTGKNHAECLTSGAVIKCTSVSGVRGLCFVPADLYYGPYIILARTFSFPF
jgi:hypothetical protein